MSAEKVGVAVSNLEKRVDEIDAEKQLVNNEIKTAQSKLNSLEIQGQRLVNERKKLMTALEALR